MSAIAFFEVDELNKTLEVPAKRDVTFYSAHGCIHQSAELNTQPFTITYMYSYSVKKLNFPNKQSKLSIFTK